MSFDLVLFTAQFEKTVRAYNFPDVSPLSNLSPGYDAYAHHARNLIKAFHKKLPPLPFPWGHIPGTLTSDYKSLKIQPDAQDSTVPTVGILGAGPGGLYTALILQDLGIPYQILEAQNKVGGRLFSYKFYNTTGAPYNFFEVGAMRFPKIPSMHRVFNLFHYAPLNTPDIALGSKVKPFIFQCHQTFLSYNGVTVQGSPPPPPDDVFKSSEVIWDTNSYPYIRAGTKAIVNDVIYPFASRILQDLDDPDQGTNDGWEYMMSFDNYSTRAYMSIAYQPSDDLQLPSCPLPADVVNWCETFDKSTGAYDRALSEIVLGAIAFGWQPDPEQPPVEWYCINDGVQEIANCMAKYIRSCNPNAITLNSPVTSISYRNTAGNKGIDVTTSNDDEIKQFTHVISTIPLPVLRTIDLSAAGLDPMQSNALRELNYGPSIKVGIQFKEAWWFTKFQIVGGQSYTDRPIRTIVYPSFGDVEDGMTTTLIASYCRTEDASRMGALIDDKDGDGRLKELVLRDLADIHDLTVDCLREQLIECKAWSWSHDPYTMGAFAFFGPGKFQDPYLSLNTPAANGFLHFAGEAISVRHAWVEGALDSAWRAVREMLYFPGFTHAQRTTFFKNWGVNEEWIDQCEPGEVPKAEHDLLLKHLAHRKPELFRH